MKRTNLRSNPEDAAYYRKHREATFHQLWAGDSPEKALADLMAQGVPSETAGRIVRALQQELALTESHGELSRKGLWWGLGLGVPLIATLLVFGYSMQKRLGEGLWSYLIAAAPMLIVLFAAGSRVAKKLGD